MYKPYSGVSFWSFFHFEWESAITRQFTWSKLVVLTTNTGQRLQIPWLWETINFHGRKAKFSVRALKKSSRSRVINKSLHKLRGLVKLWMSSPEYMTWMFDNLRLTRCFLTWLSLFNMLSLTCCVTSNWLWEIKKWVQVMTYYIQTNSKSYWRALSEPHTGFRQSLVHIII